MWKSRFLKWIISERIVDKGDIENEVFLKIFIKSFKIYYIF